MEQELARDDRMDIARRLYDDVRAIPGSVHNVV